MDRYNRRKVYLCTGLVQRFPYTMFTKMREERRRWGEVEGGEGKRRGGKRKGGEIWKNKGEI